MHGYGAKQTIIFKYHICNKSLTVVYMKSKHILIIGLILFFITIGSACASDNATDDVLADEDNYEIVLDEDDSWNTWEDEDGEIARIYSLDELSGEISVSIDNVEHFKDDISNCRHYTDEDVPELSHYYITQKQLSPNLEKGKYNLTVAYGGQSKSGILIIGNLIEIGDEVIVLNYDDEELIPFCQIHESEPINGTVKITFNGTECFNKQYIGDYDLNRIYRSDLRFPSGFKYGTYDVKVTYEKINGKTYSNEKKVLYDYYFHLGMNYVNTIIYPDKTMKTDVNFYIGLPRSATGNVAISFNGKKYNVDLNLYSEEVYTVKNVKLDLGKHTAFATYSSSKFPKRTINCTETLLPAIEWPEIMSVGQDEYIYIAAPKNSKGTATLYQAEIEADDEEGQWLVPTKKIATVNVVNGYAVFSLKGLSEGYHRFYLNYTINGITGDEDEIRVEVLKNTNGFSSSLSASKIYVDKSATLTVKGPSGSGKVKIYLDGALYKRPSLSTGKAKLTFSKLKAGTHKINVLYQKSGKFYSKTHYLTVKAHVIKMTLQKVKVKKSAKSLKIKVKLKIDGKKAKNKKVKLKFNKKVLKVRTNKKGIAKFKITKKVLKKLKVGKKVTYKAYYGGKTVKQVVKVKR